MINSTECLQLMVAHNVSIIVSKADPGRFKKEFIFLGTADGQSLGITVPLGFSNNAIELPREIFDDFLAASLIEQDGKEDAEGRTIYRLTEDGIGRGRLN